MITIREFIERHGVNKVSAMAVSHKYGDSVLNTAHDWYILLKDDIKVSIPPVEPVFGAEEEIAAPVQEDVVNEQVIEEGFQEGENLPKKGKK